MSTSDGTSAQRASASRPALPEQDLLRDPDRLGGIIHAFLCGDITSTQYSEMTLAEIDRRASSDSAAFSAVELPSRTRRSPSELAGDFVSGGLSAPQFLRLVRPRVARLEQGNFE